MLKYPTVTVFLCMWTNKLISWVFTPKPWPTFKKIGSKLLVNLSQNTIKLHFTKSFTRFFSWSVNFPRKSAWSEFLLCENGLRPPRFLRGRCILYGFLIAGCWTKFHGLSSIIFVPKTISYSKNCQNNNSHGSLLKLNPLQSHMFLFFNKYSHTNPTLLSLCLLPTVD